MNIGSRLDYFLFGIDANMQSMVDTIRSIAQYQLFWGFTSGFVVATIIHGFLLTGNPRHLPQMLIADAATSFKSIHTPKQDGSYSVSFSQFTKTVDKIKFVFGLAFILCILLIFVALFRF